LSWGSIGSKWTRL